MEPNLALKTAHVVDILGNVVGRDQQIMTLERACNLVSLLDSHHLIDEDVVFFDPFCKAGEILLACAFLSCWNRNKQSDGPLQLEDIKDELYESGRYFGLSPDERHHRLSLRTFLGNTNSHSDKYSEIIRNGNYLSEIDGRLDSNKFIRELDDMLEYIDLKEKPKKIIAVGNPPYQENYEGKNGNTGANPIYHFFLDALISSKKINQFVMVIPSRWFAGGRGQALKKFSNELRKSKQVKQIQDFQDSKTIFPTVDVKGGVCFIHWDSEYCGDTLFHSHDQNVTDYVDLTKGEIVVRDKPARTIVDKVKNKSLNSLSDRAWSWNPFDLASNYFEKNSEDQSKNSVDCFTKRRIIKKLNRSNIIKNAEHIDAFKVVIPKAVSKGGIPYKPDQVFILNKGQICTETYMVIDSFYNQKDALKLLNYLRSDFVRFLVSVKKITQDITKETWCLVPDISEIQSTQSDELYKFYNLDQDEINYIKSKVQLWQTSNR
ncbi:Eco57I restriction-modification methylase domain-containing protein [Fluoribacter gormanii]|uniref:Eco57I restriction-modification methylase domain-containing protein n=1 Tax=Fluoribacter gormanii TaxID=464 RepID=UPI002243465E|nr:Eco57I restriction-modification methylase domain-containing protein [Fluoribacter gormanii]MCW8444193.1 Eco57I restriction-modification methylase domain-containing protein [Fluoribacter gormanii]